MNTYVEINGSRYPAIITYDFADYTWDNREVQNIQVEMSCDKAASIFVDNVSWNKVVESEVEIVRRDENNEAIIVASTQEDIFNCDEYCIAGPILDCRNGTLIIKMGKPIAEELLALLEEVL